MKKLLLAALLVMIASYSEFADGQCCTTAPDARGEVSYPPENCSLTAVNDAPVLTVPGTNNKVNSDFTVDSFFDVFTSVGGSLGGDVQDFNAVLTLDMHGEGETLGDLKRTIQIPVSIQTHTGPRNPGDPNQTFLTDMFQLNGEIFGDPDFDLLRITAGTGSGLPSPGHTTLTKLPGGDFQVDSFFDITYEIDFVGAPGSILEGMAGTTQGKITVTTCPGGNPSSSTKWLQPPDRTRTGIDIRIDRTDGLERTVADDFLCTQTGPITDVHFWGSWKGDPTPRGYINTIHLSIHKDIPADPVNPDSYSRPGDLLWEKDFDQAQFTETLVADIDPEWEWWWDLYDAANPPVPNGDQKIYQYDILIDPNDAFIQEGTPSDPQIYWLDIYVLTEFGEFGWKTSYKHWNDDATYAVPVQGAPPSWNELIYPSTHPYSPNSVDMSFAITTKPISEPTEACCFDDGNCADLTVAECIQKGGNPQGAGTDCTMVDCPTPAPTEACCLPDGNCADLTLAECKAKGGQPQGSGTDCSGVTCPTPCEIPPITCPSGDPATIMTFAGGFKDNFAAPTEPASPDAILLNYITTCSAPGVALRFDQVPGEGGVPANSWLGHTFGPLPGSIVAARLQVHARATTGLGWPGTYNDHISIISSIAGCTPTGAWSSRFANLPEAGGTWTPGQEGTFCLDLAALPTTSGPVSVLSQLATGSLSILVDDDTGIDYMTLTIAVCPCKYRFKQEVIAGKDDNCKFTLPTEPASPSVELTTAFPGPWRKFDQIVANRKFGHTFTGLPAGIVAAQLEICLRAGWDIPTNDALYLEFLNPTFAWAKGIASLTALPWNSGDQKVLVLDLDNLPPSTSSVTSVLADMADGDLDVYIQDDTAVDYIILRYWVCCKKKTIPGDINLDWSVDFKDIAIAGLHWLETGP